MIKVSVVVPVFNCENYIEDCLNSILNQTLEQIEIIVINDGSTDNTSAILEKYEKNYHDKIKLLNKENEGQGKARNIGINLASGEFITFVDADDKIEPNMLEEMYKMAKSETSDIVVCDYYEIYGEKKQIKKTIPQRTADLKRDYIIWSSSPCSKLIKANILKDNNLHFLENGIYEDIAMMPLTGIYVNKISYCEKPLYYYYIRKGSTMRQDKFSEKLLSIYSALDNLENGFKNSKHLDEYYEEIEFIYIKHLLYAGCGRFLEYKEGRKEISKIIQIIKAKYPKWRKNRYYKMQDIIFKLNCNVFYTNCLWIIVLFQKLKNVMKRGK